MINIQLFSIYMEIGIRKKEASAKKVAQALQSQQIEKTIEATRNMFMPYHRVI